MKVRTISYQKAFVIGAYLQEKIGIEMELDEHDDWNEAFEDAKELVNKWGTNAQMDNFVYDSELHAPPQHAVVNGLVYDSNRNIPRFGSYPPPVSSIDPKKEDTLEKINDATSPHELDLLMGDAAKYGLAKELNEKKRKLNESE